MLSGTLNLKMMEVAMETNEEDILTRTMAERDRWHALADEQLGVIIAAEEAMAELLKRRQPGYIKMLEDDLVRCREVVKSLAARCEGQSHLLTEHAIKGGRK
jgi:hypothetical protein